MMRSNLTHRGVMVAVLAQVVLGVVAAETVLLGGASPAGGSEALPGWQSIDLDESAWFFTAPGHPGEYQLAPIFHGSDGIQATLPKGTGFIGYVSTVIESGTGPVYIQADVEVSSPDVVLALAGMNADDADYASVAGSFSVAAPLSARGFEETGTLSVIVTPDGGNLGIAIQAVLPDDDAYPPWVSLIVKDVRYSLLEQLSDEELLGVMDPARRGDGVEPTPTPTGRPADTATPTTTEILLPTATPTVTPTIQIDGLTIANVVENYASPHLVEFSFSLRDEDDRAIVAHPSRFEIASMEDGEVISPLESGACLWSTLNKQVKCILILDYTCGMALFGAINDEGKSEAVVEMESAAKSFIGGLLARNGSAQIGIYEYHREDRDPQQVIDFTSDGEALYDAIDRIWSDQVRFFCGGSRVWDALDVAVQEFADGNQADELRLVAFVSDGQDESSAQRTTQVIEDAQDLDVKIYGVGTGFSGELDSTVLERIASQTQGRFYLGETAPDLTPAFEEILYDLGGQYTLRWVSLRRTSSFRPSFAVSLDEHSDTYRSAPSYRASDHAGDVLGGLLRVASSDNGGGRAEVYLRAEFVPRHIHRFKILIESQFDYAWERVPEADGGLCGDWTAVATADPETGGTWIDLESPNPQNPLTAIPFGAFGSILRFDVPDIVDANEFLFGAADAIWIDNSVYDQTGGQSFYLPGARLPITGEEITIDLPGLPSDATPLQMVLIPAGTFTMGSVREEQDRLSNEGPRHEVLITQSFYLGKYEVTQSQWQAVMGVNPAHFNGNDAPVEQVTWNDCQEFIARLNDLGFGTFRLPTESEWEYACRSGTSSRFYWGDDPSYSEIGEYAWYDRNAGGQTSLIGQLQPNPWGLYDMSGNVWEWCWDWEDDYPSSLQVDPQGPLSGSRRVLRSGSWNYEGRRCRSAYRFSFAPDTVKKYIGLRLVRLAP